MRPIVLSGFMATGKSTVGPRLAARLGVGFVDTDVEIEKESGRRVRDLWREEGEGVFRRRELALVERLLADETPRVIAFGGGTVTVRRARHLALDRAVLITLAAAPETIVARVGSALPDRPNLALGGDPVARARELLEERAAAYAESHAVLSTDGTEPDAIVDAILAVAERAPVLVPLGARSYVVDIVRDAPAALTDAIARCAPSSLVVVTDGHVQRDRHASLDAALAPLAVPRTTVTLASGEEHKTLASVATIWDAALGGGVDRDALVLGFGGGVVGDLAGFAASALLRGLRSLLVPTSLLAMVDASVGGKTGFDHPTGKNLLGAFHQPSGVVVDLAHLSTLPARERVAGLAEVVKIALAADAPLLDLLERTAHDVAAGDLEALAPIVRRAIEAKVRVVRDDERETGRRAILNLGHTLGHALEAHGRYRKFLHGEAVALGTLGELEAAVRLGWTPASLVERTRALMSRLGLPVRLARAEIASALSFVDSDKKRVASRIRVPAVRAAGESTLELLEIAAFREAILAGAA
jgi:shikimate kinase/3-dehydroquinate synthase